ncbi:Ig domain-containing protein [Micromonospora echinospora]|uniref:Ig domain-containing protein n=1 Tax=Micromonospora echinospora TaxID=1877 RepID=UPI003A8892AC
MSVLSWCYLGTTGAAVDRAGTNSYTAASTLLSAVPGGIQFLRCGIAKDSPLPYKTERAGFVAVVDAAASLSSSVMLMAASFVTDAPVIRKTPLGNGTAWQPYTAQLSTVSGGTWVFNQPIMNWTVSEGKLPAGLTLDPVNGTISGTPTVGGVTSAFSVTCTDSYGPPQVSSPQPMTITID